MSKRDIKDTSKQEFTNDEIMAIVSEISASPLKIKDRERTFRRKYPEFADRFESLFKMVCLPSFDVRCLMSMLEMRDRILSKQMTVDTASRIVGQGLFDKYVAEHVEPEKSAEKP
jgi:hypothetical protein